MNSKLSEHVMNFPEKLKFKNQTRKRCENFKVKKKKKGG